MSNNVTTYILNIPFLLLMKIKNKKSVIPTQFFLSNILSARKQPLELVGGIS